MMKALLGIGLALALAGGIPALAGAGDAAPAQQSQDRSAASQDTTAQPDTNQRRQHHARRANRQRHVYAAGEKVRPKMLNGRHVVTEYERFNVEPPTGGDQWIKANHQLLLVSADGTVKTVIQRGKVRRHARQNHQPAEMQDQTQQQ